MDFDNINLDPDIKDPSFLKVRKGEKETLKRKIERVLYQVKLEKRNKDIIPVKEAFSMIKHVLMDLRKTGEPEDEKKWTEIGKFVLKEKWNAEEYAEKLENEFRRG